jgi:hypothetical protein
MTTTTRILFAVLLDSTTGDVSGSRRIGTADSRESAIAAVRDAGLTVVEAGGEIGIAPGEAFGCEDDVWAVTAEEAACDDEVALHNNPDRTTLVRDMTDEEVAQCLHYAAALDADILAEHDGAYDTDRQYVAAYARSVFDRCGEVWTLP